MGIGLHRKLTTSTTEILQIMMLDLTVRPGWSPVTVPLSTADGPGTGVASPRCSHIVCWQPVLGGNMNRPAWEMNHPYLPDGQGGQAPSGCGHNSLVVRMERLGALQFSLTGERREARERVVDGGT